MKMKIQLRITEINYMYIIIYWHTYCDSVPCFDFKVFVHPKMNSVINYSPSCRSKPVRLHLQKGKLRYFWWNLRAVHRQQCNWKVPRSRDMEGDRKTVHVTSVAQLQFYEATRIICAQRKRLYSTILLSQVTVIRHFWEYHNAYACFTQALTTLITPITLITFWGTLQKSTRRNSGEKNCSIKFYFSFLWAQNVTDLLLCFWTWEHFSCFAVYGELSDLIKIS